MTNESKVYFGLRPLSLCLRGGAADAAAVSRGWSAMVRRIRRSGPVASRAAAPIRLRKCPSIHSRVKSFGTAIASVSSVSSTPSASANHVRYVVSLRAPLSRPATSDHRLCAVSSTWRLTRLDPLLPSPPRGRRAYQCAPRLHNDPRLRKSALFAGFSRNPQIDPQVWRNRCKFGANLAPPAPSARPPLWTTAASGADIYWPTAPAWLSSISRLTPHLEADLPAKRASPQAPARLPCANGDAGGT